MADDERELIQRARLGDHQAIDALLAQHEKGVYRFGLRMCGSEEAAKEVLQQTLESAVRGAPAR
jgi:RNA polymerase sigma-70 factor (ECF subfamily)